VQEKAEGVFVGYAAGRNLGLTAAASNGASGAAQVVERQAREDALRCPFYRGFVPSLRRKGRERGGDRTRAGMQDDDRRSARAGRRVGTREE
jgi:hypothetical protein